MIRFRWLTLFVLTLAASAFAAPPPTASELDLMEGNPPPEDKRVNSANSLTPPFNRWFVNHVDEVLPTRSIWRGENRVRPLAGPASGIGELRFKEFDGGERTIQEMLDMSYTDAFIVLHRGRIVHEAYPGDTRPETRHMQFSVTKSYTGTLVTLLIHRKLVEPTALLSQYLPELAGSGFGDATVQNALDMEVGIDYDEEYTDPNSKFVGFLMALGTIPPPDGYAGPRNLYDYLKAMPKGKTGHGEVFLYATPATEALGWLIERVMKKSYSQVLEEEIWSKLRAERDAFIGLDPVGKPISGGGLCVTLRDQARFGQMMLEGGEIDGREVLPPGVIDEIRKGGRREPFVKNGYEKELPAVAGWTYHNQWWHTGNDHGAYLAWGINGQFTYIDPKARMVIVKFSSTPEPDDNNLYKIIFPAFAAIGARLAGETQD